MRFRFVALDLGNVLCDLFPADFAASLAAAAGTTVDHVQRAFDDQAHQAMERGDLAPDGFRAALLARLGTAVEAYVFDACWNRLPIPRAGADDVVARLRVPHAIWSNTDPIHAENLQRVLAAVRSARHRHFSFTARARKPDAAYYRAGLDGLGARAEDVLFVDDREENLRGAAALGITAVQVTTLQQLESVLDQHGVLAPRTPGSHV